MGAQALPPPGGAPPQGDGGGTPFPSPAPPQNPGNMQMLERLRAIVSIARMIGQQVPGAFEEVRQINDAVGKLQQKIVQHQGPGQPMAPPV